MSEISSSAHGTLCGACGRCILLLHIRFSWVFERSDCGTSCRHIHGVGRLLSVSCVYDSSGIAPALFHSGYRTSLWTYSTMYKTRGMRVGRRRRTKCFLHKTTVPRLASRNQPSHVDIPIRYLVHDILPPLGARYLQLTVGMLNTIRNFVSLMMSL